MEGLVEFELMGIEMFYVTELRKASCDPNKDLLNDPNQKCYFEHKYYVNPPDDHKSLTFRFELWQISPTAEDGSRMGDLRLVAENYRYDIISGSPPVYESFEEEGAFGHDNELEVRLRTLSMERANTIAIYEANSTFVGHYQEQEKMNVIQLWVTDDGEGTPFQKGPNAIVFSTSLFSNTKLHSMLEKEQLEQTPLWSPINGDYQFIAVDRDENANNDGATNNIDFVIIRRAISSSQAMEVLELLLTCYVNESIDEQTNMTIYEEAVLYTYVSTKINGTKAVKLNLNVDVLGYIPYFSTYENSEQGQEPDNRSKYTAEFVLTVTAIIVGIVASAVVAVYCGGATAILMVGLICLLLYMLDSYLPGVVEILTMIKVFLIDLVMTVLTWLGPLGWLILRAVILALIWMEFAITLAMIVVGFSAILALITLMNEFVGIDTSYNINLITMQKEDIKTDIGYKTNMIYCSSFDFEIPSVCIYISKASTLFEIPFNFFGLDNGITFPELNEDSDFFYKTWESNETNPIPVEEYLTSFLAGMGAMMALCGSIMSIIGLVAQGAKSTSDKWKIVLACGLASFALYLFVYSVIKNGFDLLTILGMGAGFGFAFAFAFAAMLSSGKEYSTIWYWVGVIISIFSIVLTIYELANPEAALIIESVQFLLGFFTLLLGLFALRSKDFKGKDSTIKQTGRAGKNSAVPFWLTILFLSAFIVCIAMTLYGCIPTMGSD